MSDLDDEELKATRRLNGADKKKTADEMFEELGYKKDFSTEIGVIKYYKNDFNAIYFNIIKETVRKTGEYNGMCEAITMQELKAIKMKCEELGWI